MVVEGDVRGLDGCLGVLDSSVVDMRPAIKHYLFPNRIDHLSCMFCDMLSSITAAIVVTFIIVFVFGINNN